MTRKKTTNMSPATIGDSVPTRSARNVLIRSAGNRATMPMKMMSEMPFPIPRSVICSPSHMMRTVPVVWVSIVIN